jgi:hypothetical protein
MEMISDLQIAHPLIIHEDGRVQIDCSIRKERSHKYEQPMKQLHYLFRWKMLSGSFRTRSSLDQYKYMGIHVMQVPAIAFAMHINPLKLTFI